MKRAIDAAALTAFDRCERLFSYLWLDRSSPLGHLDEAQEAQARRHQQFRRLAALAVRGRAVAPLVATADPEVQLWWQHFQACGLDRPEGRSWCEHPLQVTLGNWRLGETVHRLTLAAGRLSLFRWVTGPERPEDVLLAEEWANRLPLLLAALQEKPLPLRLVVWFSQHPDRPFVNDLDAQTLASSREAVQSRLTRMTAGLAKGFAPTDDPAVCDCCLFRVRCWGLHPEGPDKHWFGGWQLPTAAFHEDD